MKFNRHPKSDPTEMGFMMARLRSAIEQCPEISKEDAMSVFIAYTAALAVRYGMNLKDALDGFAEAYAAAKNSLQ